jgi:hypothetical protein
MRPNARKKPRRIRRMDMDALSINSVVRCHGARFGSFMLDGTGLVDS